MKYLIFLPLFLIGCLTNNISTESDTAPISKNDSITIKKDSLSFIGFGGLCVGVCGNAMGPYVGYEMTKRKRDSSFFIYVNLLELKNTSMGHRTAMSIQSGKDSIFDAGNQCLTIRQTGKDTVLINGSKAIVEIPIEPCVKYYTEIKD